MDFTAISIFVRAADARSFVIAGRNVGISASGVGKSIARLEQRLGVRLFHRSTRSVTLTTEGEIFLDRARRIIAEVQAAESELSQSISAPRGRLRVSLPHIGEPFLPLLADFQLSFPEVELELDFDNRKVDVIEEGYDAVIRSGELSDSQLSAKPLGAFRNLVVGTPQYFATHGTPTIPQQLVQHSCIHLRNRHTGKLQTWQLRRDTNELEVQLPTNVICNTNEARLCFVLKGVGLAYLSDFTVQAELTKGTLVAVLDDYATVTSNFNLLWPSGKHMPSKLRAFIDFMASGTPLKKSGHQQRVAHFQP